jgi:hypothetical protein
MLSNQLKGNVCSSSYRLMLLAIVQGTNQTSLADHMMFFRCHSKEQGAVPTLRSREQYPL